MPLLFPPRWIAPPSGPAHLVVNGLSLCGLRVTGTPIPAGYHRCPTCRELEAPDA